MQESKNELQALFETESLKHVPFAVLGNKIDMQRAASVQKDHAPYLYRSVFVPPINPVSDLKEAFLKEQIQQSRKVAPVVVMPFRK